MRERGEREREREREINIDVHSRMSFQINMRFVPNAYHEREKDLSVYAQIIWWCYSVDTTAMVDVTQGLVFNNVFSTQPAAIVAYKIKNVKADQGTTYVTVIKRFCKKMSVIQVFDDWICKHYPTKRNGIDTFNIWHPSRSEIKRCAINDTFVVEHDTFEVQREKLWSWSWCLEKGGVYHKTSL